MSRHAPPQPKSTNVSIPIDPNEPLILHRPIRPNDRIIEPKPILRIIIFLQTPQSLQPPSLMPINRFNRLIPIRIIHVRIDRPAGLSLVPLVSDFTRPLPGLTFDALVARRDDDLDKHKVVIGTERIGRIIGIFVIDGFGGVAFVENTPAGGEDGVAGDASFETVVD